ncbi:M24 family metallopeptidase [Lysobacter korlensis]|uniref:M24 family metallopeptidase n=1 Tax=Lysobacter korlensis TaxID=553636 RepID=A0ABV6RWD4_9GAMM
MNGRPHSAPSPADRQIKRRRVLAILEERGADALVLRSTPALAWYLDGARVQVSLVGDPVLAVVVTATEDVVLTFGNELDRLVAEELPDDIRTSAVEWHETLDPSTVAPGRVLPEADVADDLRRARAELLPTELARFRALGRDAAAAMTDALSTLTPELTERQAAARVGAELLDRGMDPVVLLAAGRERLAHRHPLPTEAPLGDRAMLVVCARRNGLILNATRWIRFGAARPDETEAADRLRRVEAAFLGASRPGSTLADAFQAGIAAYGANGFAAGEWRRHHQGGAAGYAGRDPRATPATADPIRLHQAFAWNPSAPLVKVEDTVVTTEHGVEVLSVDPRWPSSVVDGIPRPDELELERAGLGRRRKRGRP